MWSKLLSALLSIILLCGYCHGEYLREKPDFFETCTREDSNFNSCYKDNLQALIWHFQDGVPGLPAAGKFEPVTVKKLKIEHNELKIEMKNISIQGLSATNLTQIKQNPKSFSFLVRANVPKMRIDARYKTSGRLLFLAMNGKGNMWIEVEDANFALIFKMKLRDEEEVTFVDPQAVRSRIEDFGAFRIELENLFGGNEALETYTNQLFNEHWRDIIQVLRPTLEEAIDAVIYARFKKIFNYIPANYFITDVPTAAQFYAGN